MHTLPFQMHTLPCQIRIMACSMRALLCQMRTLPCQMHTLPYLIDTLSAGFVIQPHPLKASFLLSDCRESFLGWRHLIFRFVPAVSVPIIIRHQ